MVHASDVDHPLHSVMLQNTSASDLAKDSEQAMQIAEPGIGAATPSAKASFGTLSAAQKANAQRAASALAQRVPSTSRTPHAIIQPAQNAIQATDAVTEVQPYIFVNSSTSTPISGGDGLTINIALPQELLKPDERGNPQNITINLSFPDSQ